MPSTHSRFPATRFYLGLLLKAPAAAWEAAGHFGTLALVALGVLFLVNRPLAKSVSAWEGISTLWAVVPFGFLFILGLLRANYNAFHKNVPPATSGPELEIDELTDSHIDPSKLGGNTKIKIKKASNCDFTVADAQHGRGEGPFSN